MKKKKNLRNLPPWLTGNRTLQTALLVVFAALFLFGVIGLIRYAADMIRDRQTADALRQVYHVATPIPTAAATPTETPQPYAEAGSPETQPSSGQTGQVTTGQAPAPGATAALRRVEVVTPDKKGARTYPDNPGLIVSSRFTTLRNRNKDIIGWLKLDDMLDEAVTQRNNTFYMDHDAMGASNVNGAIFLDAACDLKNVPETMLLFGHNMKNGSKFGSLRRYRSASYLRQHPCFSFDTIYEEGRYAIFAVSEICLTQGEINYVDIRSLSLNITAAQRAEQLNRILASSVIRNELPVSTADRIVLLVTCTGDDDERLVVAARKLREGETEADAMTYLRKTYDVK